jgi:eukaryotic translation initiation factor 2C
LKKQLSLKRNHVITIFLTQVAASFDPSGFKYKMMYYLQGSRREMIEGLEEIMVEQLKHFRAKNRILPHRILYYRDGVSEGQFSQVINLPHL